MNWATWLWIALFTIGVIVEVVALVDRQKQTTLSRHVWWVRGSRAGRPLLVGGFAWLTYHFFFEDPTAAMTATDDWAIVIAAVLALYVRPERREHAL